MAIRPNWKDLEIYKKTSKSYELIFSTEGSREDISNWIVYFTVKKNMKDADSVAIIKHTIGSATGCDYDHDDPVDGVSDINLSTSDTDIEHGIYYYDITVEDDENNRHVIAIGRLRITEPVTQRTN